jgi:hypothetical protein
MLGQATSSSTRIWILEDTIWEGSARHPDDVVTCPNATQSFEIFQVSFTDVKRSDSIDRSDARSSRPDVVLFWEEYRYFGKAVVEDRPDAAK